MHLLAAQPGAIEDGGEAVDLGQSPGDIVLLSAADTELACFAQAQARLGDGAPALRLANLMQLGHNHSVDRYADHVVSGARLVIVRLLGGESYWPYGVERLTEVCTERGIPIAWLPGDDKPDAGLSARGTLAPDAADMLWRYCTQGGIDNAEDALRYAAALIGHEAAFRPPRPVPRAGLYWPGDGVRALEDVMRHWRDGAPRACVVFYRALLQAGSLAPVDALVAALRDVGLDALPIFVTSLRDAPAAELIGTLMRTTEPAIVLNTTGFAVSRPGAPQETPFAEAGVPVLQAIFAGATERQWAEATRGLSPRDIAMNVALPEVDGRILTRAVAFKTEARFDEATQAPIVVSEANQDRCRFVAALAAAWVRLARAAPAERRVALVLANYPNRDGRIGNGVGLDTPASTVRIMAALAEAGYRVEAPPADGAALLARLQAGPTNAADAATRPAESTLPLADYARFFAACCRSRAVSRRRALGRAGRRPLLPPGRRNASRCLRCVSATWSSRSSRRGATTSTRRRATTTPTCRRPTATLPSTRGCAPPSTPTRWCTSASTATWNGCRARRSRCRPNAFRRPRSGRSRTSIPSS